MRIDCKNYESRTYGNGETVRKCSLDLAPEAPWRCPADCGAYERRLADVSWSYGSLVAPPPPPEPDAEGIAELLDRAEDVVNAAALDILAELDEPAPGGVFRRMVRRLRRAPRNRGAG